MNNSSLASEFLIRARRTMKEASQSYSEGDLVGAVLRAGETVEYSIRALMALYGLVSVSNNGNAFALPYFLETRNDIPEWFKERTQELIKDAMEVTQAYFIAMNIDESSLSYPSIMARNVETKLLVEKASAVFELVQRVFDDFHS